MISQWLIGRKLGKAFSYFREKKHEKAFRLFSELAEKNVSSALYHLGEYHLYGVIADKDIEKAADYFVRASELGYVEGLFMAGWSYEILKKYQLAIKFYEMAIEVNDLRAFYRLGKMYMEGVNVEKDINCAESLFLSAGDKYCFYMLGNLYLDEKRDPEKASFFYQKASNLGLHKAEEKLSKMEI